jgi:hypothetical protein
METLRSKVDASLLSPPSPEEVRRVIESLNLKYFCLLPPHASRCISDRTLPLRLLPLTARCCRWQCAFCLDVQPLEKLHAAVDAHAQSKAKLQVLLPRLPRVIAHFLASRPGVFERLPSRSLHSP